MNFEHFINTLLRRCVPHKGFKKVIPEEKIVDALIKRKVYKSFEIVFVHKSYNQDSMSGDNYEIHEFLGDPLLNSCVAHYIHNRFPKIVSIKWLTRLKHNFMSQKMCAKFAEQLGFFRFIKYAKRVEVELEDRSESNKVYMSLLEDVFEAFIGKLNEVVNEETKSMAGYLFIYNFIKSLMDKIEIQLDYKIVFDGRTRLKEVYDKQPWGHMKNLIRVTSHRDESAPIGKKEIHTCEVYAFLDNKMTLVGRAVTNSKKESEHAACNAAIEKLAKYGINEYIHSPYERNVDKKGLMIQRMEDRKKDL